MQIGTGTTIHAIASTMSFGQEKLAWPSHVGLVEIRAVVVGCNTDEGMKVGSIIGSRSLIGYAFHVLNGI
jgi:hypothetical protein